MRPTICSFTRTHGVDMVSTPHINEFFYLRTALPSCDSWQNHRRYLPKTSTWSRRHTPFIWFIQKDGHSGITLFCVLFYNMLVCPVWNITLIIWIKNSCFRSSKLPVTASLSHALSNKLSAVKWTLYRKQPQEDATAPLSVVTSNLSPVGSTAEPVFSLAMSLSMHHLRKGQ